MKSPPSFADRFNAALEAAGYTKYRLHKETGVNESLLGKVSRGETLPRDTTLQKIAPLLGLAPETLIGWVRAARAQRVAGPDFVVSDEGGGVSIVEMKQYVRPATQIESPGAKAAAVAAVLETWMDEHGVGLETLAATLKIDTFELAKVMNGEKAPPIQVLREWSKRLRVDMPGVANGEKKPRAGDKVTDDRKIADILYNRVSLPFHGKIGCGPLLEASEHPVETGSVPAYLVQGEDTNLLHLAEATGDSMLSAGIQPGVLLVIRKQDSFRPGDIVLANVPYVGSTVKRLKKRKDGRLELVAESPTPYPPIIVEDGVHVVGKVIKSWHERSFE